MFVIIVNQIIKMLLLLLLGCLCYRLKLIDQPGNKMLANLLLMVINPIVALTAMQMEYTPRLVHGLLTAYALAFVTHLAAALFSTLLIKKGSSENWGIDRFAVMYSNCGFIGIPLIQSILGNEGVLYLTAYMTVFNLFSWTHGIMIMTGNISLKELKKGLCSPMIFACAIGLLLFCTQTMLPDVLMDTLNYIGGMNTPLAMMIAGISVIQSNPLKTLKNKRVYLLLTGKLLVMPTIMLALLSIIHVDPVVACTILVASACPVAGTGTAFALRFHKDYKYSSELYAFSTVVSLVTIPLFVLAAEKLLL